MSDETRTVTLRLLAIARQMAESADSHPLRLVEVSKALFVDEVVRPLERLAALPTSTEGLVTVSRRDLEKVLAALGADVADKGFGPVVSARGLKAIRSAEPARRRLTASMSPSPTRRG